MESSNEMKYAPVIIPTLCRYEHLVRCVESLRRNKWAQYTDIYVGLDYPAAESHWDGYRKIKEYLEGDFSEFHQFHVFVRESNLGSSMNNYLLTEECKKKFDRYILSEDDLEFSPNFLQFMDLALMKYEEDPDVIAISGFSYPIPWVANENCTVAKQNFNASSWGRGFWFSKRDLLRKYLSNNGLSKDFSAAYKNKKLEKMIDFAVKDYVSLCESGWSGKGGFLNRTTDIALRINLAVNDQYVVMPLLSKVRNHGYDGTGLYCQRIEGNETGDFCVDNYAFSQQPIDESDTFELIEDTNFDLKVNRDLLNTFDRVSSEEMKAVWEKAEKLAKLGKHGGAFLAGKKVLKIAARKIGVER